MSSMSVLPSPGPGKACMKCPHPCKPHYRLESPNELLDLWLMVSESCTIFLYLKLSMEEEEGNPGLRDVSPCDLESIKEMLQNCNENLV